MDQTGSFSTSSSLIRLVQANDPEAWRRLARLYAPLVYSWCKKAGLQDADIADIAQNVFTSVHKNIARFRHTSAADTFRGWLWTVTRNEVRAMFRSRAGQPRSIGGANAQLALEQLPEFFTAETSPHNPTDEQQFLHRAVRLIQPEFEPTTWRAFWRTTVDGQSAPEVAAELGLSSGAVRQAKHRVLSRLREFLADR